MLPAETSRKGLAQQVEPVSEQLRLRKSFSFSVCRVQPGLGWDAFTIFPDCAASGSPLL